MSSIQVVCRWGLIVYLLYIKTLLFFWQSSCQSHAGVTVIIFLTLTVFSSGTYDLFQECVQSSTQFYTSEPLDTRTAWGFFLWAEHLIHHHPFSTQRKQNLLQLCMQAYIYSCSRQAGVSFDQSLYVDTFFTWQQVWNNNWPINPSFTVLYRLCTCMVL